MTKKEVGREDILELIRLSELVANYEIDDTSDESLERLVEILDQRDRKFIEIEEHFQDSDFRQEYDAEFRQVLTVHNAAIVNMEHIKGEAADKLKKISLSKQSNNMYDQGKHATVDGVFLDKKK